MYTRNEEEGPRRERSGLVSRILLQRSDLPEAGLTVTWVEVAPGSRQRLHGLGGDAWMQKPPTMPGSSALKGNARRLVAYKENAGLRRLFTI